MTTTTMADHELPDVERRARKAARARRLTDPLGAKGQRHPAERLAREGRARRALLAGSIAGFLVIGGSIALANTSTPPASGEAQTGQVIVVRDEEGQLHLVQQDSAGRLVQAPRPHVQSHSS